MRAFFAGVTGLRNHQFRMDAIGNNIANVNTLGYKGSRVTFKDTFSQLFQGASRPAGAAGQGGFGTDPIQIGLGVNLGSSDMLYVQGNLQNTGINTDLAIQGDALFIVSDGQQQFYTRAGNFQFDALGRLVSSSNGYIVQGRNAINGVLQPAVENVQLPLGQRVEASETTVASLGGNLDASAATGDVRDASITVYDSLGLPHELAVTFTKTATPNEWDFAITATDATIVSGDTGTVVFDANGALVSPASTPLVITPDNTLVNQTIDVDFGTVGAIDGLSQFAAPSNAVVRSQDGFTMGELLSIGIDNTGTITGAFSNGVSQVLAQVGLADFANPGGLLREGENLLSDTANSGAPIISFVGQGAASSIAAGTLEMSNVDLAEQFTDMIQTQRGFQSISRVITTADEMLQELVNLKR